MKLHFSLAFIKCWVFSRIGESWCWTVLKSFWVWGESESEVAQLCLTLSDPWTVAHQAPPSMGFSRKEYWSGLPFLSPGDLPNPGVRTQVSRIAGRRFNLWANGVWGRERENDFLLNTYYVCAWQGARCFPYWQLLWLEFHLRSNHLLN